MLSKNTFPRLSRTVFTLLVLTTLCQQASAAKKCAVTADCAKDNWAEVCSNEICVHKSAFPISPLEIAGIFALIFFKALCTMAGVGGSAIIHPICIVLFGFVTKTAIPIATFATMVSCLASIVVNITNRHPEKK